MVSGSSCQKIEKNLYANTQNSVQCYNKQPQPLHLQQFLKSIHHGSYNPVYFDCSGHFSNLNKQLLLCYQFCKNRPLDGRDIRGWISPLSIPEKVMKSSHELMQNFVLNVDNIIHFSRTIQISDPALKVNKPNAALSHFAKILGLLHKSS